MTQQRPRQYMPTSQEGRERTKERSEAPSPRPPGSPATPLDETEITSLVCELFCRGFGANQIKDELKRKHGISLTREKPYQLIARAAAKGWIRYAPPAQHLFEEQVRRRYPFLQGVNVVHSASADDVARNGALALRSILQQNYAGNEAHIGFSGGHSMRKVARYFAELLCEPAIRLPSKIVFHALVSGFDLFDPTTDPNAFFTYFVRDPGMQVKIEFVGLYAPPVIEPSLMESFMKLEPIRMAQTHAGKVDIVVTSASQVTDEHNALRLYLHASEEDLRRCVGDILWQPVASSGPIHLESAVRAMTLMTLEDLGAFVANRKHVLLVAGPCGLCGAPKGEVVGAILRQDRQLITHLVTDSRSAGALLGNTPME